MEKGKKTTPILFGIGGVIIALLVVIIILLNRNGKKENKFDTLEYQKQIEEKMQRYIDEAQRAIDIAERHGY